MNKLVKVKSLALIGLAMCVVGCASMVSLRQDVDVMTGKKTEWFDVFQHNLSLECFDDDYLIIRFETDDVVAVPSTRATLQFRFDTNAPYSVPIKFHSNSYKSGYVVMDEDKLKIVKDILSSKKMYLKLRLKTDYRYLSPTPSIGAFNKEMTRKLLNSCNLGHLIPKPESLK